MHDDLLWTQLEMGYIGVLIPTKEGAIRFGRNESQIELGCVIVWNILVYHVHIETMSLIGIMGMKRDGARS